MTTERFSTGLLFLLALLSGWLVWHYFFKLTLETPSNPDFPDAFVNTLSVTVMSEEGAPQYQFFSPNMLHYSTNDRTVFLNPLLTVMEEHKPPWQVTATHGEARNGSNEVRLWHNVQMTQRASKNTPLTIIKTDHITLLPEEKLVITDAYVIATQPGAEIDSVGMRLNIATKQLDLLSKVHGYYNKKP